MIKEELLDKIAVPTNRGNAVCVRLTDKGREAARSHVSQDPEPSQENVVEVELDEEELIWTGTQIHVAPHGRV